MSGLCGRTLDRYKILTLLGAGGMGMVYRARDTALRREVAVKVLSEVASEGTLRLERFSREIRAVAQLSHPNIVKIHDFGQADGVSYAVMELLQGCDLRHRMRRRPMSMEQAVRIGIAVANGLGVAHHEGLLHRDIKPANIFITSTGDVKILDFGLARKVATTDPEAETQSDELSLTGPGAVVGTVGYMSPEQLRGQPLDARSDIFSLGCILYEMLSGSNPFRRESRADTQAAILNHDPARLADIRPALPPVLDLIVARCLEKDPNDRFESARDVAFALQALSEGHSGSQTEQRETVAVPRRFLRWAIAGVLGTAVAVASVVIALRLVPPTLPADTRLAVMAFEAEVDDPTLEVYAAGLTETVTDDLCLLQTIKRLGDWVLPRRALAGIDRRSLGDVHRTFNNTVALVGVLGRTNGGIRLRLSLVDPPTERPLRTVTINHALGNVASLQTDPVLMTTEMLGIEVDQEARDRLVAGTTTMGRALDKHIRSRGLVALARETTDLDRAEKLSREAVQEDPLFCAGHIALARINLARFQATKDAVWISLGLEGANRALRLEGCGCRAWKAIGALHSEAGRPDEALAAFAEALELSPQDAEAAEEMGLAQQRLKRFEDGERSFQRAIYLRPGYWPDHDLLAKLYLQQGMTEGAAVQFRHVVECAPQFALGYVKLGGVSTYLGQADEARRLFELSLDIQPTYPALSNLGTLHFEASRFADAAAMFERALNLDSGDSFVWGNLAYAYLFSADPSRADATFRTAAGMAEKQLGADPGNPWLATRLAGYYAQLGERSRGLELLEPVAASALIEPQLIANVAETFEDLGDRERALEWVERAFAAGIQHSWFDSTPTLRNLVADERFRALVDRDD